MPEGLFLPYSPPPASLKNELSTQFGYSSTEGCAELAGILPKHGVVQGAETSE